MFYEGDLRSGINTAIEQSKLVACYVRSQDDEEETTTWENDFLKDPEIADLISSKAILLRLLSPSEEASFLEQICPIVKLPTLVVIHNGAMKEYLTSGISKEDFINRLTPVLKGEESSFSPLSGIPATGANMGEASDNNQNQAASVAALLQERKVRMEADKKKKDAQEKAERTRKAAERKAAVESGKPEDPKRAADLKYAAQQKKRQQEAREERERVLKQIEDDKAERKARDATRKEQAKIAAGTENPNPFTAPSSEMGSMKRGDHCALKVRLFDGSAISSRFPSGATLEGEVREWVDQEQQVAESPYIFKHILTPFPNKEISISEEGNSLQDLGLVPNATLILVPIKDFTPAYAQGPGVTGLLSSGVSAGYGLVSSGLSSGFGFASRVLGSVLGDSAQGQPPATAAPPGQEPRQSERHELYNGGGLNFEPRRDNQDKED
ncbi:hypothetical protein VE01_02584 [Pseudogymnoascus verrucosus]|uniref:UBX domain-containing protein 2 n=1 Tax=Pseudogymnoascus verrucosus TaxID=342668 RepID=A0A1B8GU50_9PEZI|nr:uncharacterized protein VE01_02584 [Pseudogymnoascus verrucosus]OBT99349.1 hypothetical protein VE01_02584 [Pseudogymnoascus verrucosus]